MSWYSKYVLPKTVNCLCGLKPTRKQREKIVPQAEGKILEIGFGSGLNLPHYNQDRVKVLYALDPSVESWNMAKDKLGNYSFPIEYLNEGAESISLPSSSVDTVVTTFTLCTVENISTVMREIKRVLKPQGILLFAEHGLSPDVKVLKIQNRINPFWRRIAGGCELNRDIPELISTAGFDFDKLEMMYIPGWKPACYNFWGIARPRKETLG